MKTRTQGGRVFHKINWDFVITKTGIWF